MLLKQEPKLFIFMFVTQEPTIREMSVVTHVNPILETFIIITQSQHPNVKISWEDPCMVALGHATS